MSVFANRHMMGALPPPPGIIPNLVSPPSKRGGIFAVAAVSLSVSTVCIGLRIATRSTNRFGSTGWDDSMGFQ